VSAAPPERARDRRAILAAAFLRASATGFSGVLLGLFLSDLGLPTAAMGVVVAAGLSGAALATFLATFGADSLGRRRTLIALALLGAVGGALFALSASLPALAAAAFLGMVNGMGRDRGASLVIEQAALPATTTEKGRTQAFALYNVLQDAGHALGSLLAGLPALLSLAAGMETLTATRASFALYTGLLLAALPFYLRLSAAVEAPTRGCARPAVSPASKRVLVRIGPLFALDSLGGGFLTAALVTVFFHERFGVEGGALGPLFFAARVLNAFSHMAAARLARRFGLVNTMVFTHIPSSLLLITVAFAPSFPVAAVLFLLREGLVEMDVPARQSYVMAVVREDERTLASGLTHLVRMGGWAAAPAFAGLAMEASLVTPLLAGAALKVIYDVVLYAAFRDLRPPEEQG
jgi:MFS family permease